MPIEFLRRRSNAGKAASAGASVTEAPSRPAIPEEVIAQDHQLRFAYNAKTSEGIRLSASPEALAELPTMVEAAALTPVEVVPPRELDTGQASASIIRTDEAEAWLRAHGAASPITRHALFVLETLDAIDPAYETFACALLDGSTDPAGYPDFNAIIGGLAAHWDEATGDLIVRAVVGWGGRGSRGDTDRTASRILSSLFRGVLENSRVLGRVEVGRPMTGSGIAAVVCSHCGYAAAGQRALYCPKCGMRMLLS